MVQVNGLAIACVSPKPRSYAVVTPYHDLIYIMKQQYDIYIHSYKHRTDANKDPQAEWLGLGGYRVLNVLMVIMVLIVGRVATND